MKKLFCNLSIQKKMMSGFFIVILLALLLAVVCLLSMKDMDRSYSGLQNGINKCSQISLRVGWEYAKARRSLIAMAYLAEDAGAYQSAKNEFNACVASIEKLIGELTETMIADQKNAGISIDKEMKTIDYLLNSITVDYAGNVQKMDDAVARGKYSELKDIVSEGTFVANEINETLSGFINGITDEAEAVSNETSKQVEQDIIVLTCVAAITVLVSILCACIIARVIRKPIIALGEAAKKIAAGDLSAKVRSSTTDEIGELSNLFGDIVDIFSMLVTRINHTYSMLIDGELDVAIDEDAFPGEYKKAAGAVNKTVDYLAGSTWDAVRCMEKYGEGDFNAAIRRFKGPQAYLHETMDVLQVNLKSVNKEISKLIESAIAGNFDVKIESGKYKGDWGEMAEGLNKLVSAVNTPVSEVSDVLNHVANADFNVSVRGDYKGKFQEMKEAVNDTVASTAEYIKDITDILVKMSDRNLDLDLSKEYNGDFKIIKDALVHIVDTFNVMFSEFRASADQVAAGSNQITESGISLAQGASEQASSAQELSATIETVWQQTTDNAKNSEKANNLTAEAKNNGIASKREMERMLKSMADIEEASSNISKIIKVINDIAFQTNLLALNAAVEAARAGEHGKGFAVVAEEVRSLAGRSQKASSETTELINKTVSIVSEGNKIADSTAASLNNIIEQIDGIADIIEGVSAASHEQDIAISQIREGVNQVSEVIQANAAISEESASSAQQLYNQAELFKNALEKFSLRA